MEIHIMADVWKDFFYSLFFPKEERADPGGTAMPGQPMEKVEQAPDTKPTRIRLP